jgi:hypothetical protein
MEVMFSSEMSVDFQRTTWGYISQKIEPFLITAVKPHILCSTLGRNPECGAVVNTVMNVSAKGGEFLERLRGGLLPEKDSSPRNYFSNQNPLTGRCRTLFWGHRRPDNRARRLDALLREWCSMKQKVSSVPGTGSIAFLLVARTGLV